MDHPYRAVSFDSFLEAKWKDDARTISCSEIGSLFALIRSLQLDRDSEEAWADEYFRDRQKALKEIERLKKEAEEFHSLSIELLAQEAENMGLVISNAQLETRIDLLPTAEEYDALQAQLTTAREGLEEVFGMLMKIKDRTMSDHPSWNVATMAGTVATRTLLALEEKGADK